VKIAAVFPGQGSQYVGMGKAMADQYPEAAAVFAEADQVLGFSLSQLCWEGPEEDLKKTTNTQPAVLTASIACWRVLEARGVQADLVAGHSLGEYSALVAAGALTFAEALQLVRFRGQAMEAAVPYGQGTMAAILGMSDEWVRELCLKAGAYGVVEPANFNSPGQVVISGSTEAVAKALEIGKEMGGKKMMPLAVGGPFHSSLMAPARQAMADRLAAAQVADARIPVAANASGRLIQKREEIIAALVSQVDNPVLWVDAVQSLASAGVDTYVEAGPGRVLGGLIKKIVKEAQICNVEDPASLENSLALLKECR